MINSLDWVGLDKNFDTEADSEKSQGVYIEYMTWFFSGYNEDSEVFEQALLFLLFVYLQVINITIFISCVSRQPQVLEQAFYLQE